jgi:hypothetical protein
MPPSLLVRNPTHSARHWLPVDMLVFRFRGCTILRRLRLWNF